MLWEKGAGAAALGVRRVGRRVLRIVGAGVRVQKVSYVTRGSMARGGLVVQAYRSQEPSVTEGEDSF